MYLIKSGNMVIYDSTDKDTYPVVSPSFDEELNGSGTLTFTILPGHPYYDQMKEMQTFVTAYRDNEEIFYGRILSTDVQIDGQMEVHCEGGLTFFMDTEIGKGKYNETCEAFLTRILNNHNSLIEVPKQFTLGTINVVKATEYDEDIHSVKKFEFEIKGYASTKSVMESLILGQFGGFFRIRPDGEGGHVLDYLENYGRVNTQPVQIGHNIVDRNHRVSGEGMFTILRPLWGKNKTIENLTQADVTLPNVTKDGEWLILDDLRREYGSIYHTEAFDDDKLVTSAKACLKKAEEFIVRHGTQLPASLDIGFVDFYHLNKKNVLNITPTNHNAWSFYGIPNVLLPNTRYTFSINGPTTYSYSLWLSTSSNTTRMLADEIGSRTSVIFTTPETMTEEFLVLSGSAEGAGLETLNAIDPQVIKTIDDIRLGDVFTTIEELEGITLTVGNIHLDMENPGNDTMTLKNSEELYGEGVTSNSLTVIESKYQITDAFRYHYINETLDDINAGLDIWGPRLTIATNLLEAYTDRTYLVVRPKPDDPTSGEMVLQALRYGQMPTDPDAPYQPTIQLTLGGVKLSNSGEFVDSNGNTFASTASLQVLEDRITSEVTAREGADIAMQSQITQTAEAITSKVSAGDIASTINQTAQSVLIQASKINLVGYVTIDELEATNAEIENLISGTTWVDSLNTNGTVRCSTAAIGAGGMTLAGDSVVKRTVGFSAGGLAQMSLYSTSSATASLDHYHQLNVDSSTGTVTIGIPTASASAGTFNIADTTFYQQAVSAATATGEATGAASLAGNWSSNLFFAETSTSTQSPASQIIAEFDLPTTISSSTLHSGSQTDIDITVTATTSSSPGGSGSPVNFPITVDATPAFNAGAASVTQRTAIAISTITLAQSDTGSSVSKNVTVSYNNSTSTANVPVTINASQVWAKGYSDGYPASIANITLAAADTGTATKTATVTLGSGSTANMNVSINASAVYGAGVSAGEANKAPSSWWAGSSYFSLRNSATRTFSTNITCQREDGTQVRWNYQFTVTAGD